MESNIKQLTLLIKNAYVFDSALCQFIKKDIAIMDNLIIDCDKHLEYLAKEVIDATGKYIIPGLVDIHMHIESSMTSPQAFYKKAVSWGTTTLVADPHEIANVYGIDGIQAMISNAEALDIFFGIPSSVPSTSPQFETTGGMIDLGEVNELLEDKKMICLGEVMNFKDLQMTDSKTKRLIKRCKETRRDFLIEGHCPKLSGQELSFYLASGIDADHTQQTPASILEKVSKGMFLEIQAKSITKETIATLVNNQLYDHFCFVTDDCMANHLQDKGHLFEVVKKAVHCGMPLLKAIYCATLTPSRRMHLDDRGMLAPGKKADLIILDHLESLKVNCVYKNGKLASMIKTPPCVFPEALYHSIKLEPLSKTDFLLPILKGKKALCNIISIHQDSNFTTHKQMVIDIVDGKLDYQAKGLSLICVFERYGKNHNRAYGLVEGTFTKSCAVASTWAHDHHNLMVMGNDENLMVKIANEIIHKQGGYGACCEQRLEMVHLNVGGIISDGPLETTATSLKQVTNILVDCGYVHMNPIMSFVTLSLPVSPEIKITDCGLIIGKTQQIVPLVEEIYEYDD